jgi:tetratricopeptide (TPR) repeat protein
MRGLRPRPSERWPSMHDLLDELERDPRATRTRWAIAAGVVTLVVAAAAVGLRPIFVPRIAVCGGGPDMVGKVWEIPGKGDVEPPTHARIRGAFLRTGKSYAPDVFATVSKALTSYAQQWASVYRENCEATHVRGDQSSEVLDLRMSCLQERLGGFRALTGVFESATGEVVENAVSASNALGSLDRCSDVPLLRAVVRPPEDRWTRDKVDAVRIRLTDLKARFDAGRWKEVLTLAPGLVQEASGVGYKPLIAEAQMLQGRLMFESGNPVAAEQAFVNAFWLSDAARHDEIRAEAAERLVFVVGYQEGRFADAERWATATRSVLQRMGGHELLQAWLLNDLAGVHHLRRDGESAVRDVEAAMALKQKVLGREHPDAAISEGNLGIFLHGMGREEEALAHMDHAMELLKRGLGPGHPQIAIGLNNRGDMLSALHRYREARLSFEGAQRIWERELGPDNLNLGYTLTGIGLSYLAEDNPLQALPPLERAFKIRRDREPEASRRAETAFALAQALSALDRDTCRARLLASRALHEYEKADRPAKAKAVEAWTRQHESAWPSCAGSAAQTGLAAAP